MNPSQALAKIKKVLGPKTAYRISEKAVDAEERAELLEQARALTSEVNALEEAQTKRRNELLKGDPGYVEISTRLVELRKKRDHASYYCSHKRISVGINGGLFFSVRAEGDNWDEVVGIICKKAT